MSVAGRRATVITVSDGCAAGTRVDVSGPAVAAVLLEAGFVGCEVVVVADEVGLIGAAIAAAAGSGSALVATTGGTGLAARDVTPEATMAVCERMVPGLAELMRTEGAKETKFAALSRGVCGTVKSTWGSSLVVNLPGSPKGAASSMRVVLPLVEHALELLAGRTEH